MRVLTYCLVLFFVAESTAKADLFPVDLVFSNAVYRFDLFDAEVNNEATQSGTIFSRVGGSDTTVSYVDEAISGGTNPLSATLTHHGNGVVGGGDGFGGTASVSVPTITTGVSDFFADTDLGDAGQTTPMTITNVGAAQAYRISLSLTYDHEVAVDATGFDGHAESDLELLLNGLTVFEAEIISDTFPIGGNSINKVPQGASGGTVADTGTYLLDLTLNPGDSAVIGLDYTMEGGVFDPTGGPISGSASYFLSVDNVVAIPEPGHGLLFLCSLVGLGLRRRRAV